VAEDLEQRMEAALGIQQRRFELRAYPALLAKQRRRLADEVARLLCVAFEGAGGVGLQPFKRLAYRVELREIVVAGLPRAARDRAVAGIAIVRGKTVEEREEREEHADCEEQPRHDV